MAAPLRFEGTQLNAEAPVITTDRPDITSGVASLALVPDVRVEVETVDTAEQLRQEVQERMSRATTTFMLDVSMHWRREPETAEDRATTVSFEETAAEAFALPGGWQPASVKKYNSNDPWQNYNPELADATNRLIEATMAASRLASASGSRDSTLTYFDSRRASGGKRATLITDALINMDAGIGSWVKGLPAAERLRVVAGPWSDNATVIRDKEGNFEELPLDYALNAVVGGANDGLAVREREAWEHVMVKELVDSTRLDNNTLHITSLGTGTGEPAMDTGLAFVAGSEQGGTVVVNGFDINPNSLAIASYLVEQKQSALPSGKGNLVFNGAITNLLSEDGIAKALNSTQPKVVESIGFSEYVPSEYAPSAEEQQQRRLMERIGNMSAEQWYKTIYNNMPEGSVWLTGNMRTDSPQLEFVMQGLGWQGIIARGTEEYLAILQKAGIPGEAVNLFVPGEDSSGVYNLVAIKKPYSASHSEA